MLWLALGKLYRQALVIPGKLDERLRRIASLVNGGLTDDNLAPATQLPATAFAQGRQVMAVTLRCPQDYYVGLEGVLPALPFAATLLGLEGAWATTVGSDVDVTIGRWTLGGVWEDLVTPVPKLQASWAKAFPVEGVQARGGFSWSGSIALAVGDHLTVKQPAPAGGNSRVDMIVTAYIAMDPVA